MRLRLAARDEKGGLTDKKARTHKHRRTLCEDAKADRKCCVRKNHIKNTCNALMLTLKNVLSKRNYDLVKLYLDLLSKSVVRFSRLQLFTLRCVKFIQQRFINIKSA